jgi:glycosyltransferase involved in cell wall biosynthesis
MTQDRDRPPATRPLSSGVTARAHRASVVIPAHDEARVIERCLHTLLDGAEPDEFEIVVVANGCTDDTAARARRVDPSVTVVEVAQADKAGALNVGDTIATSFPRFYLDADVQLDAASARRVASALADGPALAAAPVLVVDTDSSTWPVRAWYRMWRRTAWSTESMIGSGVCALSAEGRSRFGPFPDVKAEDLWISSRFAPEERRAVDGASFTVTAAANLPLHVRRTVRVLAYNRLLDQELRDAPGRPPARGSGIVPAVRADLRLLPPAALYAVVAVVTHTWAAVKVRRLQLDWVTDR